MLGFDRLAALFDQSAESNGDAFPPFNIEVHDKTDYRIILAVAGYGLENLCVEIERRELFISGFKPDINVNSEFLHRGIAARQFVKRFVLADPLRVVEARLENGLLCIFLHWQEQETPRTVIPIIG